MSNKIGTVTMALDAGGATWNVACSDCPWGTDDLLATGFDGYLGVENYELVQALAEQHSAEHS